MFETPFRRSLARWERKLRKKGSLAKVCQRDLPPPQANRQEETYRRRSEEGKGLLE